MKSKKGQEGVIVTVILVLIAIVAVGAIAYFIVGQVKGNINDAGSKADCLKVDLTIKEPILNGTKIVTITRGTTGQEIVLKEIRIFIDGKSVKTQAGNPGALEEIQIPNVYSSGKGALAKGEVIKVYPILANGFICETGGDSATVA